MSDPDVVATVYVLSITLITVLLCLVTLTALAIFSDEAEEQCSARRAGRRCIHGTDHPGSHRDEFGDYWN